MTSALRRAAAYPRAYADALALRRHLRTLPPDPSFDDVLSTAHRLGVTQKRVEIEALYDRVRDLRPARVLEIGLDRGGTLLLWSRAAASNGHLVSLEARSPGPLGRYSPFSLGRLGLAQPSQRLDLLMPVDSHAPAALERIRSLFGNEPIDFLFVDGDHSFDGVRADFTTYGPLVRPGGLVAFHDISPHTTPATEGTARFWAEFAADHETEALVADDGEPGFGIGLYRVPG